MSSNRLLTATDLHLTAAGLQVNDSVSASPNGSDFYRFALSASNSVSLTLNSLTANSDVNVELLDHNGTPLVLNGVTQASNNPGNFLDALTIDSLDSGVYYLHVYTSSGNADYRLNLKANQNLHSDLVWRNYGTTSESGKNDLWRVNGLDLAETLELPLVNDLNWQIAGTGDFDHDRQTDLLWRYTGTTGADLGKVLIWTMNGDTPVQAVELPVRVSDVNWQIAGVGDFNQDGHSDLLWRNYGTTGADAGKVVIWTMNGVNPVQSVAMPFAVADINWRINAVGDFNHDTHLDLVWRYVGTTGSDIGKTLIWTMNGANPVQTIELSVQVPDLNWQIVGVSDFNQDRNPDLLWRYVGTSGSEVGKVVAWGMDGVNQIDAWAMPTVIPDLNWQIGGIRSRSGTPLRIDLADDHTNPLDLGVVSTGGVIRGFVGDFDTEDSYRFTVASPGVSQIFVEDLSADAYLVLLDSNGNELGLSWNGHNSPEVIGSILNPGETYYIKVIANHDANTNYTLRLSHHPITNTINKTGDEDVEIPFTATEFTNAFNGGILSKIRITAYPRGGILWLNGELVNLNQEIDISQLVNLRLTPIRDFYGTINFAWNGFNGTTYASEDVVVTATINSVNDRPTLNSAINKLSDNDQSVAFSLDDFVAQFSDVDGDSLQQVKITSLPTQGILQLNGVAIALNQEIVAAQLSNLVYVPNGSYNGIDRFTWNASDGQTYALTDAIVNLNLFPVQWYRQDPTGNRRQSDKVVVDAAGNVYTAGEETIPTPSGSITLPWLAKRDANSNQLWFKYFKPNNSGAILTDLEIDNAGNLYLTGGVWGGTFPGTSAFGYTDLWVAKIDANGNPFWFNQVGSSFHDYADSVTVDNLGNVYISANSRFGLIAPASTTTSHSVPSSQPNNSASPAPLVENYIAIVKFDSAGNRQWVQQLGVPQSAVGGLATDSANNLYVTGDGRPFPGATGTGNRWLAKYNTSGNLLWATQFGDDNTASSIDVKLDSVGNIYVTGYVVESIAATSTRSRSAWVAKFTSSGDAVWLRQFDASYGQAEPTGLAIAGNGDLYLSGTNWVAKYDNAGNQQWLREFGSKANGIALSSTGDLYLTGYTLGTLFDPTLSDGAWLLKLAI
jgi:hypothetical protein